jgi:regulator of CtrA degradation
MQMQTHIPEAMVLQKVVFMPSLHNEAMDLLHEAQGYFTDFGADDQAQLEPHIRAIYSCEMSRITLRLSCIMSWLLEQRSIAAGGTSKTNKIANNNKDFKDICLVDSSVLHGILPSYVCYLLDASLELYERAQRMAV